uniref:Apolipoprotein L3 n=1 Tax=Spermophilus dauricus TaxID=99837 RepID=A0A8C9QMH4_SPEDA
MALASITDVDSSREEADALYEALNKLRGDMALEDKDLLQTHVQDRERFLQEFPQVKAELEKRIEKLRALADRVDKVHKDCTISHVVANSTGAASGVFTILGLALAPVTAGVSAAGDAVTTVSTSSLVSKNASNAKAVAQIMGHNAPKAISLTKNFIQVLGDIGKHIRAIKLAKANPRLVSSAQRLMTTGRISIRHGKQVQRAFGGTALAMTKGARIMGAATAGICLLMDVIDLVKTSTHLHEGAKAESAQELRQKAQELEEKLQELIQTHERLRFPLPHSPHNAQPHLPPQERSRLWGVTLNDSPLPCRNQRL